MILFKVGNTSVKRTFKLKRDMKFRIICFTRKLYDDWISENTCKSKSSSTRINKVHERKKSVKQNSISLKNIFSDFG